MLQQWYDFWGREQTNYFLPDVPQFWKFLLNFIKKAVNAALFL